MILYTVQHENAYKKLLKKGYLEGDSKYIPEYYLDKYTWLVAKMREKLKIEGNYPIWFWRKEELCKEELVQGYVLLKVNIPEGSIVATHFDAWNSILHDTPIALNEDEWEVTEEQNKKTWERIFEINKLNNHEYWEASETQYTAFNLESKNILEVLYPQK